MRWAEHVVCRTDAQYVYWVAAEGLEGQESHGTDRLTFADNIKIDLKNM